MKSYIRNPCLGTLCLIFLIMTLPRSSLARPSLDIDENDEAESSSGWRESELGRVKLAILNELGLHMSAEEVEHLDQLPKANISEAEYRRAYGEYMRRVRMRNLEEKELLNSRDRRRNSKRVMQIFNPESIHTYDNVETRLNFNINLNLERRSYLRIKRAMVKLPEHCFYFDLEKNKTLIGEVDVTQKMTSWVMGQNDEEEPFGLTLFCSPPQDNIDIVSRKDDLKMTSLKVVTTQVTESLKGRRKRSYSLRNYENHPSVRSRDCDKTRHGRTCCRRSMKINFADLNIKDWILEPKEFDAHMCSGRCNARRVPFATTHAMLQHTLHQTKEKTEIPRPCCTPTKLRHLDVLHIVPGTDTLKITILANAIVDECSCS